MRLVTKLADFIEKHSPCSDHMGHKTLLYRIYFDLKLWKFSTKYQSITIPIPFYKASMRVSLLDPKHEVEILCDSRN